MADLHELTALEQAAAVRRREVRPSELVEHYLRRVQDRDDQLGAFVTVTADRAMDAARAADALVTRTDPAALPPLFGVPTAIKDLTATAGVRTTFGSTVYAKYLPPVDDDVVRFLAAAGTISLGKTSTPEFGLTCYTEPAGRPPAVTPWDTSRSAGGSSGGAAAAVAAGLVPFAQGSDGGGSIRGPAAVCGLVGLKPSRGRVSRGPAAGDVTLLSVIGPLARSVGDAAALLDAMAVPCPAEPVSAPPLPPGQSFLQLSRMDPGRLRIGRYADSPIAGVALAPECRRAWEDTAVLLADLGHEVVDTTSPFDGELLLPAFEKLWAVGATSVPVPEEAHGALLPFTQWLRARGAAVSGPELLQVMGRVQGAGRAAVSAHQEFDAVLAPILAQLPRPVGWFSSVPPPENFERQKHFIPYAALYNVTGQPAICLPMHWTDDELPVAVQLVGRPAGEAQLLALAGQLERARPWAHRRPPTW
ncbi:MAG TPA: amidase [Pseudonocardiaceae bacterium]|nr:amidase [Pseudonocardiaceae bacterium]